MLRRSVFLCLSTVAFLVGAVSPAAAATLWVDPLASGSETACTSAMTPCTLQNAVAAAQPTDAVVVMPGTYAVSATLTVAKAIEIRGYDATNPPTLAGASNLSTATLSADSGLQLKNLKITGNGGDALTMKGGAKGDRLILRSESGDGAKLVGDVAKTALTNSLVTSGAGSSGAALKLRDQGTTAGLIELRNVTASATATGASGIRCETTATTSTLVNTIVRGDVADVDASVAGSKCSATNSNLRTTHSPGLATTNAVTVPATLDAAFKPQAGSSTIDAGVDHADNGLRDLAYAARTQGAKTDIGAYEFEASAPPPTDPDQAPTDPGSDPGADPGTSPGGTTDPTTGGTGDTGGTNTTGTTGTSATGDTQAPPPADTAPRAADPQKLPGDQPALPAAAPPQLGKTMLVKTSGNSAVLVRLPGTNRYVRLSEAASIPFGTTIDTRKGAVTLSSALPNGKQQTGTFSGGLFEVRQRKNANGMTDILLRGAKPTGCTKKPTARAAAKTAKTAKKAKKARKTTRRLWAKDKGGRFRTHGDKSVATVRGTKWLTEDRCDGTLTKVVEGAVDVKSKRTGKTKRVKAGRSLLVKR